MSQARWKESDLWSSDLEGDMEKLEFKGSVSQTEGGSMDPTGKVDHWSARIKNTKEGSEEEKGAENKKQGRKMEVDEASPGKQTSNNETDGSFKMWRSRRSEGNTCRSPRSKKKSDTCGISRHAGLRA